jgi:hypothetical protein
LIRRLGETTFFNFKANLWWILAKFVSVLMATGRFDVGETARFLKQMPGKTFLKVHRILL